MKILTKLTLVLFLVVVNYTFTSCDDNDDTTTPQPQNTTIVDIALANNLTSLAAALQATDLVTTLQGEGPFTVFAPTNEALNSFIANAGLDLNNLTTEQTNLVENILLNHVIIGKTITASDIATAGSGYENTGAVGPNNKNLSIYYNYANNTVTLNGTANVTDANKTATNGVIHIIDEVINLPTVVTFAAANPNFSTLVTALSTETPATDFVSVLSRTSGNNMDNINPDFTVFAPTNSAFDALLNSNNNWDSLADIDDTLLTNVLLYHVVGGANIQSSDLNQSGTTTTGTLLSTQQTIAITLPGTNGNIANITDAAGNAGGIVAVDVQAINGVIHVVDNVLLPNL